MLVSPALRLVLTFALGLCLQSTAAAAINWSGDVAPGDPTTWTDSTDSYIGDTAEGSVSVFDGSVLRSSTGRIGDAPGSTGVVTVTGAGSEWDNRYALLVGRSGDGTLTIEQGGLVINAWGYVGEYSTSTGSVTVTGAGSQWHNIRSLYIGQEGDGTLTVEQGGVVTNALTYVGVSGDSTGSVTVTGAGSQLDNSRSLNVGYFGSGSLTIEQGGVVRSSGGRIGDSYSSKGVVNVRDAGSQWINTGSFIVGGASIPGGGFAPIEGGVGSEAAAGPPLESGIPTPVTGQQAVEGLSSTTASDSGADGALIVTGGGEVISQAAYLGYLSFGSGYAEVDGADSTWTNHEDLTVGRNGKGTLTITNNGQVRVGGTLTIDQDTNGDGFLNLATGGTLALAGDVDHSIIKLFSVVGGSDAIRFWDATANNWTHIFQAARDVDYTLEYLSTGDLTGYTLLTVHTTLGLTGDYNGDNVVDGRDYAVWRESLGSDPIALAPGTRAVGPGGTVGEEDLQAWLAAYGGAPTSETLGVPEPTALSLLLLAALQIIPRQRQPQRG